MEKNILNKKKYFKNIQMNKLNCKIKLVKKMLFLKLSLNNTRKLKKNQIKTKKTIHRLNKSLLILKKKLILLKKLASICLVKNNK